MDLMSFCAQTSIDPSIVQKHKVIAIHGETYPLLFLTWWNNKLKTNLSNVLYFDCSQVSLEEAQAQLLSYFLGSTFVYLLHSLAELDRGQKQEWINFLRNYQGPHTLIVYCQDELEFTSSDTWTLIKTPLIVNRHQFSQLCTLVNSSSPTLFANRLFAYKQEISFDFAFMALWYALLIGKNIDHFFSMWVQELIEPDQSLFTLSQYFFGKQSQSFFKVWYSVKDVYPLAFWIAFWSEQLWRAYMYIYFMNQQKTALAKKAGYKLPFSFLQKDWKQYKAVDIQYAHDQLYSLDYRFKQGLSVDLELFYCSQLYKKKH